MAGSRETPFKRNKKGDLVFTGYLAEPIPLPPLNSPRQAGLLNIPVLSPEERKQAEAIQSNEILREQFRKLEFLAAAWGLESEESKWLIVAFLLATEFVPGFRTASPLKRRRGRPSKVFGGFGPDNDFALQSAIDELRTGKRLSIARACHLLSKRAGPWKGKPPGTLETRYHNHKKWFKPPARMRRVGGLGGLGGLGGRLVAIDQDIGDEPFAGFGSIFGNMATKKET